MRIAEYKSVGTHTEQRTIHHDAVYDEVTGSIAQEAYDEVTEVEVPNAPQLYYRDATPEEEAEMQAENERMEAEMANMPLTIEERMDNCESTSDMAYINSEIALAIIEEME